MSQTLRPYDDLTDVLFALAVQDFPDTYARMGTSLDDVEGNLMYLRTEVIEILAHPAESSRSPSTSR